LGRQQKQKVRCACSRIMAPFAGTKLLPSCEINGSPTNVSGGRYRNVLRLLRECCKGLTRLALGSLLRSQERKSESYILPEQSKGKRGNLRCSRSLTAASRQHIAGSRKQSENSEQPKANSRQLAVEKPVFSSTKFACRESKATVRLQKRTRHGEKAADQRLQT
jgi:hypothetical protein